MPLCGCGIVSNNSGLDVLAPELAPVPETDFTPELDGGGEDGDEEDNGEDNLPITGGDNQENGNNPPEKEQTKEPGKELNLKSYAVSTVNGLNVRSAPSTSGVVIGSLDKNDAVVMLGKTGNFIKTVYKERTAYVYSSYCNVLEIEPSSNEVEKAIDEGCKLLGYPYVWGSQRYHWGNGKLNANFVAGEFDCSALTQYIYYKSNGVILDVTTRTQVLNGKEVDRAELSRGDLMFFTNASRKDKTGAERIGHVAIYFGNNYILHTASDHAVIEPISNVRWGYYITARRVI